VKKSLIASIIITLGIASSLQAHTVSSDEIKQFASNTLKIDFDKAPEDVQKKISEDYTKRIKLSEALCIKLKNDPEYTRITEAVALDLWVKRITSSINPTDVELKKAFDEAKNFNIPLSYKLHHIVIMQESLADDLINQLKAKKTEEKTELFTALATTQSLDQSSKQNGGLVGWVESTALPQNINNELKDKKSGDVIKLPIGNDTWEILLVDEIKAEHPATFDEAKDYLINMMRQQAIENEAKKIFKTTDDTTKGSKKLVKKSK
jgi:parvulin-like peptidyl-prolyl isomerase